METLILTLSVILILGGLIFLAVGVIGILRLPDFFTRSHSVGAADSLGIVLLFSGVALHHGLNLTSLKILFVLFFIYLLNPIGTHALVRAALRSGLKPWTKRKEVVG